MHEFEVMMNSEKKRVEHLERTILELGTEVFRVKNELAGLRDFHENFVGIVGGLKKILDEKGLITSDDFDGAVDLGNAISYGSTTDHGLHTEMDKLKKFTH